MLTIEDFVEALKQGMEQHAVQLKHGDLFLPKYLRSEQFTSERLDAKNLEETFRPVAEAVGVNFGWDLPRAKTRITFQEEYVGRNHKGQVPDFAFKDKNSGAPTVLLELESLDRSQLYLFTDGCVSEKESDIDNKLWHYYGNLGNYYSKHEELPRYFVFFLVLPDQSVTSYRLWDIAEPYQLYHKNLESVVYKNPYRFFDGLIKTMARAFLKRENEFLIGRKWIERDWRDSQQVCELIFITCTIDRLILSRGCNLFDPQRERSFKINWRA